MPKKQDKLSIFINNNTDIFNGNENDQDNKKLKKNEDLKSLNNDRIIKNSGNKVAEKYFELLEKHKNELNKEKLTVMIQVGSFFEVYGYINKDGSYIGNVWEIGNDAELNVAEKKMEIFGDRKNQLYMAGVKEEYVNKYIDKLVDKEGWTIVIYEQYKENGHHERKLKNIISPGINFENDNINNIFMYIYIKSYNNRLSINDNKSINYGVYYIDCISGNTGCIELYSEYSDNISVELNELLKIITIQNPKEIIIHLDIHESIEQLKKDNLYTNLILYNRNIKFIENTVNKKYETLSHQRYLLENIYTCYKSNVDILITLNIYDYVFARIAICLGIDYIKLHNSNIINNLSNLMVGHNNKEYLMLANNCLNQLDILNNETSIKKKYTENNKLGELNNINKITLLDILNNTKTIMGSRLFRNRLSMPITSIKTLNNRYNDIEQWINIQNQYLNNNKDNNIQLSPLNKIRNILGNIKDIPKYMRKMATKQFKPYDITIILKSFDSIVELYNLVKEKNLNNNEEYLINDFEKLILNIKKTFDIEQCNLFWNNIENNIFLKGYDKKADNLQNNVDSNTNILNIMIDNLKIFLNKFKNIDKFKYNIKTLGKYGKHIYINGELYDFLTKHISTTDFIQISNKKIYLKDINYIYHKKNYYIIKCKYIEYASRSLTNDIEILQDYVKNIFIDWQINFYQKYNNIIDNMIKFIEYIDLNQCNSYNAIKYNYCKPYINNNTHKSYFKADNIRHPLVEIINSNGYISNDISLGYKPNQNGILLYGPNAAGKSTLSKAIGINIIMAQAGFYVPSNNFNYHPYNYIFTRIKNNDNLHAGLSSFQVEMRELKVILDYCNNKSIVLGDEILNSTNSLDATAIMSSALIKLHDRECHFMFATHLHFLTQLNQINDLNKLKMYHMGILQNPNNPNEIIYERKIRDGSGPKSYAILISQNMNLDNDFIEKAYNIRRDIEEGKCLKVKGTLEGDNELIQWNRSKYNKNKIIDRCQICMDNAVDVHHINEQNCADMYGYIASKENTIHKNNLNNLISLCKECHQNVHSVPQKLNIKGYIETSNGLKVQYKWINEYPPSYNEVINNILDTPNKKINYINTDTNTNTDIKTIIHDLKYKKKSIRSIQYTLRKEHNVRMKLLDIEKYIS